MVRSLTYHVELEGEAHLGLGVDLALIHARVPALRRADLQRPVLGAVGPDDGEALVRRVRQHARRQDVQVALPDPRDLRQTKAANQYTPAKKYVQSNNQYTTAKKYVHTNNQYTPAKKYVYTNNRYPPAKTYFHTKMFT